MNMITRNAPRATRYVLLLTAVAFAGCDEDPIDPTERPSIAVETTATAFAETDPAIGTDERIIVRIRNTGGGPLTISTIQLDGADVAAFAIEDGDAPATLAAGASEEIEIGFTPSTEGMKTARLIIVSNDPTQGQVEVVLRGESSRFQYRQVDRMGIPGLNTVFNHPSGVGPFDKRAYNLSTPAGDVAAYAGQFAIVLGAVGNADPEGTAALLLPDELPVNLGAPTTSFAMLTGRALADDAVDVALSVTVGIASLQSDNVDANDKTFRAAFPYVATPHQ